jgi:hypothetical protein
MASAAPFKPAQAQRLGFFLEGQRDPEVYETSL